MEFNPGKKMFSEWEDGPFVWWLKLNLLILKKYEIQAEDNRTKQGHKLHLISYVTKESDLFQN